MTDEIHSMICLSTAHVMPETRDQLECVMPSDRLPVHFAKGEHGWFLHVPEPDAPGDDMPGYPQDIHEIIAYARARGCGWVMLDSDGPVVDDLKTWEW